MNFWRMFDLSLFAVLGYLAGMNDDLFGIAAVLTCTLMFSLPHE